MNMAFKRWDIINALIEKYDLKSYLEIGVFKGECFDKVNCELKHSVDPEFPATFQMTSDEFFNQLDRDYDIVFVDGLHTSNQTFYDLYYAYVYADAKVIVAHDCNPATEWHTRPVDQYKRGEEWNGTSYLGVLEFAHQYHTVTFKTVDADYGCAVFIDIERQEMTWEYFDKNRKELLNLISVDEFRDMLA